MLQAILVLSVLGIVLVGMNFQKLSTPVILILALLLIIIAWPLVQPEPTIIHLQPLIELNG
jgi:hypothetical protein